MELEISEKAKHYLGEAGYSEAFGARPLKRVIQNQVETAVAKLIVEGKALEGSTIDVDADDRGIVVSVRTATAEQ